MIHLDADKPPPVDAFWSVTVYDAEGYRVANELNRSASGVRDVLQYNADGSLDVYLQHANPGPDKEANWLPALFGPLGVTLRLCAPRCQILGGRWHPPVVRKARQTIPAQVAMCSLIARGVAPPRANSREFLNTPRLTDSKNRPDERIHFFDRSCRFSAKFISRRSARSTSEGNFRGIRRTPAHPGTRPDRAQRTNPERSLSSTAAFPVLPGAKDAP